MITSGNVDKTALKFPDATALAIFAKKSKAFPGLFNTFFAILFDTLSLFLPRLLKNSLNRSAYVVLSLTVI